MAGHGRRAEHWVHWMRVGGQGRVGHGRPAAHSRLVMLLPYIATLLRHGRCCGGVAAPGWAVCWRGGARAAGRVVQAGGEDCAPTCKQSREAGCVSAHLSCVYSVITIIVLRELPLGCGCECSFVVCIVAASLVLCVCAMCVVPRRACSVVHAGCLASITHTGRRMLPESCARVLLSCDGRCVLVTRGGQQLDVLYVLVPCSSSDRELAAWLQLAAARAACLLASGLLHSNMLV